jgi:hypothetical protein
MDGVTDATHAMGNLSTAADPKQQQPSAFQIAVSVAHAAEHKVRSYKQLCVRFSAYWWRVVCGDVAVCVCVFLDLSHSAVTPGINTTVGCELHIC